MPSVLHAVSSLHLGGAERFTIDLASLQRRFDVDARILSLGAEDEVLVSEVERNEIPHSICPFSRGRLKNYRTIAGLFAEVDVVHMHSPYVMKFLSPLILLFPGKKYIYTRHGLAPLNLLGWRVLHQLMRPFINKVTFVTSAGLEVFRQNQRWDPDKLIVVENGVLVPETTRTELLGGDRPLRLGAVGRLVELKGHRILLEGFLGLGSSPESRHPIQSCELHIYGSGPLEQELKEVAMQGEDSGKIQFHGTVLDRESVYENIDVLTVCSETEGLSMVIIEAMARGIPVIATEVGGNPILVQSGRNGILIPYNDIERLRAAIVHFMDHPEDVLSYGAAAKAMVESKFTLVTTHNSYMECYASEK